MGNLLFGKTIGIIGYGKIGKHLSKLLKNFGVKILFSDVKKLKNKIPLKKLLTNSRYNFNSYKLQKKTIITY